MSVTISESGLYFGEYGESRLFYAEQSSVYKSLGDSICTIEFALYNENDEILMVEAKSSSPKPSNQIDFDGFINEIYDKFAHSIDLYFSLVLKRLDDSKNDMPDCFRTANYSIAKIKLILVINGHKIDWLAPISDALRKKLKMQIKTWRLELAVINHEVAAEYGLLK